jgi:hypothetical protein
MHLAGEADGSYVAAGCAGFGEYPANGKDGSGEPIFRALLGPERMLHANFFVGSGDGSDLFAGVIDQECAGAAGACVYAKPVWSHGAV